MESRLKVVLGVKNSTGKMTKISVDFKANEKCSLLTLADRIVAEITHKVKVKGMTEMKKCISQ